MSETSWKRLVKLVSLWTLVLQNDKHAEDLMVMCLFIMSTCDLFILPFSPCQVPILPPRAGLGVSSYPKNMLLWEAAHHESKSAELEVWPAQPSVKSSWETQSFWDCYHNSTMGIIFTHTSDDSARYIMKNKCQTFNSAHAVNIQ